MFYLRVLTLLLLMPISLMASASQSLSADALLAQRDDYYVLDVRTPAEYAEGHVPDAKLLPYDQITADHKLLPDNTETPIVLYCRSGRRAGIAAEALAGLGYTNLYLLQGSMQGWLEQGLPVEHASTTD
ncbi:hypothetical protein HMF8227_02533 [Saliniradius amylolyticus]|uniref:Rhodanese domain-containing protein n=1 Tax=Saliniradius amylolyticus TaxID=2183582 RepID=A0A2S2E5Q3_9ALTE|nr:rhodanese-like domain-containing protein [Saliniradius amylolyticus]AWL12985.1 hypothetical protein HMF8227_02533 [Saliniradius amylolyticus]